MPGRLEADSHKRELVMDLYIVQYCKRSHQNKGQETNKQKQPKTNHKQQTREKWDSYQLLAIMRTMTSCVSSYSTVEVPSWPPCFYWFFGSCFGSHDEAGLLAFEALQGLPRLPEARMAGATVEETAFEDVDMWQAPVSQKPPLLGT